MPEKKPPLIIILGPTASGKTAVATKLAKQINGAVVSADSRQVYAGLNIGAAKPKDAWLNKPHQPDKYDLVDQIKHYLLNIREPNHQLSLSTWQSAAKKAISTLIAQNVMPILTGGTMLYIDSIIFNYHIPHVQPQVALRQELEKQSSEDLFRRLKKLDPAALAYIEPNNKRRIVRALEVIFTTNQPFSVLRKKHPSPYHPLALGLFPGWPEIENNIRRRAQAMLDEGLMAEIEQLRQNYGSDLPLLQTINYRQAPDINAMVKANLRYAKRQMSWWKRNSGIQWFSSADDLAKQAIVLLKNNNHYHIT